MPTVSERFVPVADLADLERDGHDVVTEGGHSIALTALVAVGRYFAAHFPTRREREQALPIAARLQRGERIHE